MYVRGRTLSIPVGNAFHSRYTVVKVTALGSLTTSEISSFFLFFFLLKRDYDGRV